MRKLLYKGNSIEKKTIEECINTLIDDTKSTVTDWFFLLKTNGNLICTDIKKVTNKNYVEKSKLNTIDKIFILCQDKEVDDIYLSLVKPKKTKKTKEVTEKTNEEKPKKRRGRPRKKVVVEENTSE